jgi:hypothetical protein
LQQGKVSFVDEGITNETDGKIEARGKGSSVAFADVNVDNFGVIAAKHHGNVSFNGGKVGNEFTGTIFARGRGSEIDFTNVTMANLGIIAATHHGVVTLTDVTLQNGPSGIIEADDGGKIFITDLQHGSANYGLIEALDGGKITIVSDNNSGGGGGSGQGGNFGDIDAIGRGSIIRIENNNGGSFDNHGGGIVAAEFGGEVFFRGDVTNHPDGKIEAVGCDARVIFSNGNLDNVGVIAAKHHGAVSISHEEVTNEAGGKFEAAGFGSVIKVSNADVFNLGRVISKDGGTIDFRNASVDNEHNGIIEAKHFGTVSFNDTTVQNETGGLIEADGCGAQVFFSGDDTTNNGAILATHHGAMSFCDLTIQNGDHATIEAKDHGTITFDAVTVTNQPFGTSGPGGKIEATDWGVIKFEGGGVTNGGLIEAKDHSFIEFKSIGDGFDGNPIDVTNSITDGNGTTGGTIKATDYGTIKFLGDEGAGTVNNDFGVMEATHHGTLVFDDIALNNSNGGLVEATHEGAVIIKGDGGPDVTDGGGTIAAIGWGSKVDILDGATIAGDINNADGSFTPATATLKADGGTIFVSCDSHLQDAINVDISGHGLADFANVINANATVTVDFSGPGTFELDQAPSTDESASPVTITDFGKGDTIDLTNLEFTTSGETVAYDPETHILTVTDNGTSESFTLDGNYTNCDFALVSDPHGGTDVVFGAVDRWTGEGPGNWNDSENWSRGVPGASNTAEIVTSGTYVIVDDRETVGNLIIGNGEEGGALDIVNGGLTVLNAVDDGGQIRVGFEDPYFQVYGPVRVEAGASIEALTNKSFVDFFHDQVGNAGNIEALDRGSVSFHGSSVWNEGGTIEAWYGGLVTFDGATVSNDSDSTMEANGYNAEVDFSWSAVTNDGRIEAKYGGIVDISHSTVTQGCDGVIAADRSAEESNSLVNLDHASITGGTLETYWGGLIQTVSGNSTFDSVTIAESSQIQVSNDTSLTLEHTIDNNGTITLGGEPLGGSQTGGDLAGNAGLVIDHYVTLTGYGQIVLAESSFTNPDYIVSAACGGTLDNVNNIISGAGTIGDCHLTLVNEANGVINADGGADNPLVIDTGHHQVVNNGLMEATGGSELDINSDLLNTGTLAADGGIVNVAAAVNGIGSDTVGNGGILDFQSYVSAGQTVTFTGAGTLKIDAPASFGAEISMAHSDPSEMLDLGGFGSKASDTFETFANLNDGVTTLTVTDETQHTSESVKLAGDFTGASWNVTADGSGGADVSDPPATVPSSDGAGATLTIADGLQLAEARLTSAAFVVFAATDVDGSVFDFTLGSDQINLAPGQTATDTHNNVTMPDPGNPGATVNTMSVSIGGPGNDNFVFKPGVGADTIVNFNPQADTIELDHFANVQNTQALAAAITHDAHGDAVIELGHGDSIAIPGMTPSYLQANLQSLVHLH